MSPDFLSVVDILELHRIEVERHGGSDGVRDPGLLASAVAQPSAGFGGEFLHEDLFAMAAAYLFHIVKNHPFIDGNKRTGFVAALAFLELNGLMLQEAPSEILYEATMAVAEGRMSKAELTEALRALPWGPTASG
ncbi:type II toxin-antitoxin system death-on-curing family toxin [Paludisphaera rhizosphaerae]|uniref:type II toxin-antitoxin system death-on-curing family toxin n=1 Tax=Paludisphaera rhizosphaerae TaxID=2711216 RepID=UPI0013EDDC0E|nr:type II toxin-antitoxin system death-on-curing family toxin [Paludisphaera rhizosphaerae]